MQLREPANRVSPRAPWIWVLGAVIRSSILGAVCVVATLVWGASAWLLLGYAVVALGYIVLMPLYRYRVHRWESTDTAVYTQSGWVTRERRIAPMSRVQTVDLHQSVLSRLFGLANVTVTTASAAGPVRIEALDREVAERLVDELTQRAAAEPGDAT